MARHPFKRSGPGFTVRPKTGRYKRGSEPVSGKLVKGLVDYFYDTRHEVGIFYPLEGKVDTLRSLLSPHINETFDHHALLDSVITGLSMDLRDGQIYDAHCLLDPLVMALHSYDYNNFYLNLTTLAPYQTDIARHIEGKQDSELSVRYKGNVVSFGKSAINTNLDLYGKAYLGGYGARSSKYVFHDAVALAGCGTSGCDFYLQSADPITPNLSPAAKLPFEKSDIYSSIDIVFMDTKCPAWGSNFYVTELELSDKERIASTFFSKLGNTLLTHSPDESWEKVTL